MSQTFQVSNEPCLKHKERYCYECAKPGPATPDHPATSMTSGSSDRGQFSRSNRPPSRYRRQRQQIFRLRSIRKFNRRRLSKYLSHQRQHSLKRRRRTPTPYPQRKSPSNLWPISKSGLSLHEKMQPTRSKRRARLCSGSKV